MHRLASRLTAASIIAVALLGCGSSAPEGVVLVGGTLIDGRGGPPRPNMVVVVRGGTIEAVGAVGALPIPKKLRQVDVSGRWVLPGFIDAHAHVARWTLPHYLAAGVTTVRDLHGTLDSTLALRADIGDGRVAGPRIYTAGTMIDGLPATHADAIPANSPTDGRKGVDRVVRAGVDGIKVYTRVDRPLLVAIIDEAKAFSLPVAAHLGLIDAVTAAKLGVRSIEHLSGIAEAAAPDPAALFAAHYRGFFPGLTAAERRWAGLDSSALARVARELAHHKVFLVPTLVSHETTSRLNDSTLPQSAAFRIVPPSQRDAWNIPALIRRAGWTDADFEAFQRSRPAQDRFLRLFAAAGGRIVTGTDAPNPLLIPGDSEHRELELLVAAGLEPRAAILAATRDAAALLRADSIGIIGEGKVADLVILTKDPLQDIQHTRAIEHVMIRGRLMSVDSLRRAR